MHRYWKLIYLAGTVLCVFGGYFSLAPERTAKTNADWVLITILFIATCLFPVGAMAFGRRNGIETFRRPSLDRPPLGWWRDTLQPLRVSQVSIWLYLVGACFALPKTDQKGMMLLYVYA